MVLWPGSGETAESFLPIRLWVCWLGPWNFKVQNANKYPSLKNIRKPVSKHALNLLFPRAPLRTQVRPCPCCMLPWRQPDHPPCFHLHPESLTPWETNQTHLANQFCIKNVEVKVASDSLLPHGLLSLWNSPGQNTGVGILSLLQGIFPTQGLDSSHLHCRRILYQLSHKGSPRILEWVAYLFSSGFSGPRNWTRVSCIAGRFFTSWAMREAHALETSRTYINTK